MTTNTRITETAAAADLGKASATKRGRNALYPYVPVILHEAGNRTRQEQILALAYRTRDEAVDAAQATIDLRRADLARKLGEPRYRALREQYGLPRELEAATR